MKRSDWAGVCAFVFAAFGQGMLGHNRSVIADEVARVSGLEGRIPAQVAAEARRLGIALANIKRQGDCWIGCDGTDSNSTCVVLGRAEVTAAKQPEAPAKLTGLSRSSVLEVHQYGQAVERLNLDQPNRFGQAVRDASGSWSFQLHAGVEARVSLQGNQDKLIDTLPQFRREGVNLVRTKDYKLVRDYIDARPSEPFNVIVTVPALCEPCRQLDKMVHDSFGSSSQANGGSSARLTTKLFILEYFSFADAERELLGAGAVFPTTLVYSTEVQPRQKVTRFIGNLRGGTLEDVARPLLNKFHRGVPHTMTRGLIGKDLLLSEPAVKLSRR